MAEVHADLRLGEGIRWSRKRVERMLAVPYSPTTTGKVERFHKTLRAEWVSVHEYVFGGPKSYCWPVVSGGSMPLRSAGHELGS